MTARRSKDTKRCEVCAVAFHPWEGKPGRTCSRPCANKLVSVETATKRGDALRGRGEGRTYPKRAGRHEHRVVAEQMLGRPLLPGEVVHHKNHDKRDNRPENLEVLPSQSEHAREHSRKCAPGCTCRRHLPRAERVPACRT